MPIREENREKAKTIIVAACVAFAVLLIISLVVSLISLASATSRKNRLQRQLNELNTQIERLDADRTYYQSSEYIEKIAREYLDMAGNGEITFIGK
ncbi:MAG: septum formation initiator family protein [Clostridiales bacterium]|nr:septum formation initiator family protein [Clostridiales bacterium]